MASPYLCSPEIYQLKQPDSGQDFFIGPLSTADVCPVFTNLMYSCGIKDTHSSSKKPVFYLGAVSLLISTKNRTAPQRRREKKKDGELAVGKTEQRIMEYYAGAIHPESGLRRCSFILKPLLPLLRGLLHDLTDSRYSVNIHCHQVTPTICVLLPWGMW